MDATAEASSSINAEALFERVTDAVQSGTLDRAKLDECIRAGFDVNAVAPMRGGLTVLHIAAIHAHPACIALLVAAGANVNARAASESGHTPLHCAANSHQENLACIAALLAAGADPNLTSLEMGRTPLHFSATRGNVRTVAALLAAGANTEVVETAPQGFESSSLGTPLAAAVECGNPNAVPTLLRGGAKNYIGQFERELQQEPEPDSGDESDEPEDSGVRVIQLSNAGVRYLRRVAEAGGYRKYERRRRAAVMARVVRSSKLPAALLIWVEHVADSFPDPLEERGLFGARRRLGY